MTQGITTNGWFFLVFGWGFHPDPDHLLHLPRPLRQEDGGRRRGRRPRALGSRIGLVLAMAGNAIGLGNFLRFPVKAASNGGGAFLIPYFVALILMGVPMMWVEWTIGRHGRGPRARFDAGDVPRHVEASAIQIHRRLRHLHPFRHRRLLHFHHGLVPGLCLVLGDRKVFRPRQPGRHVPVPEGLPGGRVKPVLLLDRPRPHLLGHHLGLNFISSARASPRASSSWPNTACRCSLSSASSWSSVS